MEKQEYEFLRPNEAADFLRVSPSTLAKWRILGQGPRFAKLGGTILYQRQDLLRFVEEASRK